jgi:hypothetical protein
LALGTFARVVTHDTALSIWLTQPPSLRKPLYWHIQSLRELRDGLGGSRTATAFEVGQIALADACFDLQMQLRLVAPLADRFQSSLTSKNRGTNRRG